MAENGAGWGDDIYRASTRKIVLQSATCCQCEAIELVTKNTNFTGIGFVCIECEDAEEERRKAGSNTIMSARDNANLFQYFTYNSPIATAETKLAARRMLKLSIEEIRKRARLPEITKKQLREILNKHNI